MTNKQTVNYAEAGERDLKLDIFLPDNVEPTHTAVILLHGTADRMVPCTTSRKMFNALHEKDVVVELHLYPNHNLTRTIRKE